MEITIHSVIENINGAGLAEDEPEISITTLPTTLAKTDEGLVISYSEEQEKTEIHTEITILQDGSVKLDRRGGVVWCVIFKSGEECNTLYNIPPYSFDCTVRTKRADVERDGNSIKIRLIYSMNIGGGEKEVKMRITVK